MRYKEFNANTVLEKSTLLLWKHGFEACSISDIVNETRVNRFSLYQEFTSKEGILLAALKLYEKRDITPKYELLEEKEAPIKDVIRNFFYSYLDGSPKRLKGCFILHIATEMADSDEEVRSMLMGYMDTVERKMIDLLERYHGTKKRSIFYARQLMGLFCTTMSFCLIHTDDEQKQFIDNGLSVILNKKLAYV